LVATIHILTIVGYDGFRKELKNMNTLSRREFSASSLAFGAGGLAMSQPAFAVPVEPNRKMRVAVIGHTGRGDYGHGLNTMWNGISETELVAVADADAKGLASAIKQLGEVQGFPDYRKMLAEVQPDIVAIGMRHVDQHRDVAIASIEAHVRGIYMEKPFCRTPKEADEIVKAAAAGDVKVAIAHRNRYHPVLPVLSQLMAAGEIGRVLEYRMRGKEDARGGTLDLWVLGSHLTNLVHFFAGKPKACSANVLIDGRQATRADATPGAEGLGLMAGNEVHARFEMENGLYAFFDSIAKAGNAAAGFGLQIIGTEGVIDLRVDREPLAHIRRGNPFQPTSLANAWLPITSGGIDVVEPIEKLGQEVAKHWRPGRDLVQAITTNREPLCSARDAATTIEMITAVATSHLQNGARVELPLTARDNPWG
jgi:predicted dehydrogenase